MRRSGAEIEVVDDRIDHVGFAAANVDPDAAGIPLRQTVGHFLPLCAAIGGFENSAAGTSLHDFPGEPDGVVHGGVEHVGVAEVDGQVYRAAGLIDEQLFPPGAAAIGSLEDAAFLVGSAQVSQGRDPDDVRVGGMDDDAGDVLRIAQAHIGPGVAAVGRLVDSVAPVGAARQGIVAGSYPHYVGIGGSHGHCAHRGDAGGIGDGLPGGAVVGGTPHAAGSRPRKHGVAMRLGRRFRHGQGGYPRAGAPGSEVAVLKGPEKIGVGGVGRECAGGQGKEQNCGLGHAKNYYDSSCTATAFIQFLASRRQIRTAPVRDRPQNGIKEDHRETEPSTS